MLSLKIYNQRGLETGKKIKLNPAVFDVQCSPFLIQTAVAAQRANSRFALAHTKTRAEVRGGGRKPWRQKGTGRARHGSIRSPLWRGGGVTFGPRKTRIFSKKINKKAKQKALLAVLSDKVKNNLLVVLDKIEVKGGKTKQINAVLQRVYRKLYPKEKRISVLFILQSGSKNKLIVRAIRNIPYADTLPQHSLNLIDLLRYKVIFVTLQAVKEIEAVFNQ